MRKSGTEKRCGINETSITATADAREVRNGINLTRNTLLVRSGRPNEPGVNKLLKARSSIIRRQTYFTFADGKDVLPGKERLSTVFSA